MEAGVDETHERIGAKIGYCTMEELEAQNKTRQNRPRKLTRYPGY